MIKKIICYFPVLAVVFLASCASTPKPAPMVQTSLSLIVTANREATLEPCGCSMDPWGGIDREYNLLQNWKIDPEAIVLSSGMLFVPESYSRFQDLEKTYLEKAEFLISAMNVLQTRYVAPSAQDLHLGLGAIRNLQRLARFSFLSANLRSKENGGLLFEPYEELYNYSLPVLVIGMTSSYRMDYPKLSEARVEKPVAALREIFTALPPQKRFIVVFGNLTETERSEIIKAFPEVNVIVGGDPRYPSSKVVHLSRGTLYVNPTPRGQAVSKLDFNLKTSFDSLYNENEARDEEIRKEYFTRRLKELETERHHTRKRSEQARLQVQIKEMKEALKAIEEQAPSEVATSLPYTSQSSYVNENYATPKNELASLVDRYKERLRSLAVKEP